MCGTAWTGFPRTMTGNGKDIEVPDIQLKN
jgi:hypothetical protein